MVTGQIQQLRMQQRTDGFIYLWALFAVALAGMVMAGTGQVWKVKSQREKEAELMFIGEQFRIAILSYYNSSPGNSKEYPKSLEDLLLDSRSPSVKRHLRRIYRDPMTNSDEWGLVEETAASTGTVASSSIVRRITGVHSLSERKPLKKDKFPERYAKFSDAVAYREWQFVFKPGEGGGKGSSDSKTTQPAKPGQSTSPFAPQSSPGSNKGATTSPLAPQSSAGGQPKNPSFGFPGQQQ